MVRVMEFDDRTFEDFSKDLSDFWSSDYGDSIKVPTEFDFSFFLEGNQSNESEVILNDRLMSEASLGMSHFNMPKQNQCMPIKSEHSYSLKETAKNGQIKETNEYFPAVVPAEAEGRILPSFRPVIDVDQMSTSDTLSCCDDSELLDNLDDVEDDTPTIKQSSNAQIYSPLNSEKNINYSSTTNQITCIDSSNITNKLRKGAIYFYPKDDKIIGVSRHPTIETHSEQRIPFPPTPPSSSGSDSDSACSSPPRVPLYDALSPQFCHPIRKFSSKSCRTPISTPLISHQPKGAIGVLHLTEEEKKTLISEGYPIPSRLPLTKSEEKSLKKIRRKIKNKISAQESRRKKKEYMDTLESKVEKLESENVGFKKRIDILQKKNSLLLQELQVLQNMVKKDESRRTILRENSDVS